MTILDNKIDLYYFTGTMRDGGAHRHARPSGGAVRPAVHSNVPKRESAFADIRPLRQASRTVAEGVPRIPDRVLSSPRAP